MDSDRRTVANVLCGILFAAAFTHVQKHNIFTVFCFADIMASICVDPVSRIVNKSFIKFN